MKSSDCDVGQSKAEPWKGEAMISNWILLMSGLSIGALCAATRSHFNLVDEGPTPNARSAITTNPLASMPSSSEEAPLEAPLSCPGGAEADFEVTPVVDLVTQQDGSEHFTYHLDVRSSVEHDLALNYSWMFANDRGHVLAKGEAAERPTLEARSVVPSVLMETPRGLPDGFYRATFIVAGLGERGGGSVQRKEWWLHMVKGQLREIESDEWLERSNARFGFKGVTP
jgi:hypothetical protein